MHITAAAGKSREVHIMQKTHPIPLASEEAVGQLAIDILETAGSIFIVAPIAGVDQTSVSLSIDDDLLVIQGERPFPTSLPKAADHHTAECYWGKFQRSILLPTAVNSADLTAKITDHVLMVEIPKARKLSSQTIPLSQYL